MGRVNCASCGHEHDLADLEPSFDRPDAYFELSEADRATRTLNTVALCAIRGVDGAPLRCFIRMVIAIPVRGESKPFCWGAWAEVAEPDFVRFADGWDHPDQEDWPSFPGRLANAIPLQPDGAPPTLGLPGDLSFTAPREFPTFVLQASVDHPFAVEQREGIYPERLFEYVSPALNDR